MVKRGKSILIISLAIFLLGALIALNSFGVDAQTSTNTVCAERTLDGAWCQNVPESQADPNYRSVPSSCESTSFCQLGTCIDSTEGTCLPNVPQRVCEDNQGSWDERASGEIPQCQLGCCTLADQASFVTQTSCKRLSSTYGVETNFRSDIQTEAACIASAAPQEKGACVFEEDFQSTCRLLTRDECQDIGAGQADSGVDFYEGLLCSAESLATNCGPTEQTTCVEDKDQVYFVDSCGNLGNVYDASRVNDPNYWNDIVEPSESCGINSINGNANSEECGNCNYLLGSTCKAFERGETARPDYGNFICKDLGCEWEGESYQHGETWCATSSETNEVENAPGEEQFRLVCYNNEVSVEPCAPFRNEVCKEAEVNDFSVAACRINVWNDCAAQNEKESCEDIDKRDCQWLEGETLGVFVNEKGQKYVVNDEGELVDPSETDNNEMASCVPKYAPGFDFWSETDVGEAQSAENWCPLASDSVLVKFEKKLLGDWKCKENCDYIEPSDRRDTHPNSARVSEKWEEERNSLCAALGDCGSSVNYIGVEGYDDGEAVVIESPPEE